MLFGEILKEFPLFEGLDDTALKEVAELCHERRYDGGAICFVQGRKATELHLCRSGSVDIIVRLHEPWGIEVTVHTVNGGEVLGWSALVEPYIYTASAKCVENTTDICINASDLMNFLKRRPDIGYQVMMYLSAVVSARLTETRLKLAKAVASAVHQEW